MEKNDANEYWVDTSVVFKAQNSMHIRSRKQVDHDNGALFFQQENGNREDFSLTLAQRMQGVFATMWFNTGDFIRAYYKGSDVKLVNNTVESFKQLFSAVRQDEKQN